MEGAQRPRRLLAASVAVVVICVLAVAAINIYIVTSTRGQLTTAASAPHAQAAIVLGARITPTGLSPMLEDRVRRGVELYKAGKVDKVLVSGDNGQQSYNEVLPMRKAVQAMGVPDEDIFMDHAGFDTRKSMIRARKVFGVERALVVTQKFHIRRALYLADRAGIDAKGVTADIQDYNGRDGGGAIREVFARIKAFGETLLGTDVLLGPKIPIEGDGRKSWE